MGENVPKFPQNKSLEDQINERENFSLKTSEDLKKYDTYGYKCKF